MRINQKIGAGVIAAAALGTSAALAVPALAANPAHPPNGGSKAAFFTGGIGTAGWVSGNDTLVAADTDGKVMQLSSPNDGSYPYAGFQGHGIDGLAIADITALSYDFNASQTGNSLGSPRLVIEFVGGSTAQLGPAALTANTWVNENGMTSSDWNLGNTDGVGCAYGITWAAEVACHSGATVKDAFVVNDSGYAFAAPAGLTVQVDNLTLNSTVYSAPASSKK
jgi:hypothetical protein